MKAFLLFKKKFSNGQYSSLTEKRAPNNELLGRNLIDKKYYSSMLMLERIHIKIR